MQAPAEESSNALSLLNEDSFKLPSLLRMHSSSRSLNHQSSSEMMIQRAKTRKKVIDERLADLTINKLKVQSMDLLGRAEASEILQSRLKPLLEQEKLKKSDGVENDRSSAIRISNSAFLGSLGRTKREIRAQMSSRSFDGDTLESSAPMNLEVSKTKKEMRALKSIRFSRTTISRKTFSRATMIKSTRASMIRSQVANMLGDDFADLDSSSRRISLEISTTKKELVLIKGPSGVGKTSLAKDIKKQLTSKKTGFFAEGKYDMNHSKDGPYFGIADAYSELIRELWKTDRDMLLGIGEKMLSLLGDDVAPLVFLIPELDKIVAGYSTDAFCALDVKMEGMQDKWDYSFRILTQLLTTHVKPLVILIDDLQWADKASLDLIDCLISDAQNLNPLMVIGCYRSDEVDETSDLSKSIKSMMDKRSACGFEITEIALECFGSNEVNQMVMTMMNTDDENSTKDLAELCFQRTLGNPFFVVEFMKFLEHQELIKFNIGAMKWVYDVSKIEDMTMSTANVVEMLQSRMQKMPADVQLVLSIAACLGPTFRVSILEIVWRNLGYVESKGFEIDEVPAIIEFMEGEMLVEEAFEGQHRWVHDQVQEAALNTLIDVDNDTLRFQMGKVLYLNLNGGELDDVLFDVADLVTCGKGREKSEHFASLCLKAATKALRLSAFQASAKYIQSGIAMLPSNMWISHRSLTLELYTLGSQVELALGKVEQSKEYCSIILNRDDVDMTSKIPLRVVEIRRLSTVELKYAESIEASQALMKDLKFNFSWNRRLVPVQALSMLSRTINAVKSQPTDFYENLGRMDKHHGTIVEILWRIIYASQHTREMTQVILCSCHIAQMTLKYGLCEYSGSSFALIGSLAIQIFKMHGDAPSFREISLSAQSHFGEARAPLTLYCTYSYNLAWLLQLPSLTEPFFEGYVLGMQNGDVDVAMDCLLSHSIHLPYSLGTPIDQVLEECPIVITHAGELSQTSQAIMVKSMYQMFLNLRNSQQDPCLLKGEEYSVEACGNQLALLAWHEFAEFQLLFFYNDPSAPEKADKSALKSVLLNDSLGYFAQMIEKFHRGVCLYVAARHTKKRKYKQHAKKIRNTMHKWKKVGNPNVVYYCIFLDAEHAALEGKYDKAEEHYMKAIKFVARTGYLHHAALFNELYSDFLLRELNDKDEAKYRLEEAIKYYEDWGALGKVHQLKKSSLMV